MAGSYLFDIDVYACYGCGADVEPGYHFCARCLDAASITPVAAPSRIAPLPVHIVECHPSDAARMSAIGYRLVAEIVDPGTGVVTVQAWVRESGEG